MNMNMTLLSRTCTYLIQICCDVVNKQKYPSIIIEYVKVLTTFRCDIRCKGYFSKYTSRLSFSKNSNTNVVCACVLLCMYVMCKRLMCVICCVWIRTNRYHKSSTMTYESKCNAKTCVVRCIVIERSMHQRLQQH